MYMYIIKMSRFREAEKERMRRGKETTNAAWDTKVIASAAYPFLISAAER